MKKTNKTIASLQAVPSPSRASPSLAHFDFPPFLRPATQAKKIVSFLIFIGDFKVLQKQISNLKAVC